MHGRIYQWLRREQQGNSTSSTMIHATALLLAIAASSDDLETMRFLDFSDRQQSSEWRPIHDGVMGGLSRGRATQLEEFVRFTGEVSLENNGGFASFRIGADLPDLSKYDGVRLRVRGDGKVYKFRVRTEDRWDGASWTTSFATTTDEWTTVDLPFSELIPSWRGRLVTRTAPFDPSKVRQLGIMIADKQEGWFELDVASIDAWRAIQSGPGTLVDARVRTERIAKLVEQRTSADALSDALRWTERLLVVTAPRDLDADVSIQIGKLMVDGAELAAADLRIVNLMGTRGGRLAARTLSKEQVRGLRERWDLPSKSWGVALIGKDGSVKARWEHVVETKEILALINSMPMRAQELEQRPGKN